MSLMQSPSIVRTGLLAAYDVENNKSYGGVNLIQSSNSFSTAGWGNSNITVTGSATTGPNGESASRITEVANSGQHLLSYSIGTVVVGETFTWSASFKPDSNVTQLILHTNGEGTVTFDILGANAGTVTSTSGANTIGGTITSEANGWFRCAATFRKGNTVGTFYISNQRGLGVYTGETTYSYFICNAQIQTSNKVTAYQLTTGTAGNRTIWYDQIGTNNATLVSSPYYNGSERAMVFNGSSSYITFASNITLASSTGWSIGMWVKQNATQTSSTWNYFILNSSYEIGTFGTNSGTFVLKDLGAAGTPSVTTPVITGGWNYLVFGITGSLQGFYKLYNSAGYSEASTAANSFRSQITLTIDRLFNGSTTYYGANCPIIQIYNKPLSTSEVTQNFAATRGRFGL